MEEHPKIPVTLEITLPDRRLLEQLGRAVGFTEQGDALVERTVASQLNLFATRDEELEIRCIRTRKAKKK